MDDIEYEPVFFDTGDAKIASRLYTPDTLERDYTILTFPGFNTNFGTYIEHAKNFSEWGVRTCLTSLRRHEGSTGIPGIGNARVDSKEILNDGYLGDKIAVVGNSFGGYACFPEAIENPNVGAICLISAPNRLSLKIYTDYLRRAALNKLYRVDVEGVNFDFGPSDHLRIMGEIGFREVSLMEQIYNRDLKTPVLFIEAGEDDKVPSSDSLELYRFVQRICDDDVEVRRRVFAGQNHKMDNEDVTAEIDREILSFFDRSFGLVPEST